MYEFGSYQLDPDTVRLLQNGIDVDVEPQIFNTLLLLIKNRERVVSKGELLEKIWHGRSVTDYVITRIIYELRKIVDDANTAAFHIRTVRGQGYQFVAKVTESEGLNPYIAESNPANKNQTQLHLHGWLKAFALLVVIMIAYLMIKRSINPSDSDSGESSPVQNIYPSIAVLPIEVAPGNEELSILVQSLIDYLTNQLALNLNMKVIHPDSLMSMANQLDDIYAIQQTTRSDFIIQGFVQSVTDQSINLHLILYKKKSDGEMEPFPLGAFEFPYPKNIKELNDLYKQRKVTVRSIVKIIEPSMTVNDDGSFETADSEAYRLVIAAHHMSRSDDCKDMQRAEQLLLKAVERDDEFVYAYLQLFTNYYKRVWICGESTDYHQKGLAMAEIIDRLAPNTYQSVATRRSTILVESNQVEQAYEFSKNADWNNPDAIYDKSYSLRYAGFLNITNQNLDRILQLDPFFFNEKPIQQAPSTLLYQNRFDAHLALLAEPGNSYHDYFRGLNLFLTDDVGQAAVILQGVVDRTAEDLFGQFSEALLHIIEGDDSKAVEVINYIVTLRKENNHTDGEMTYKVAQLYTLANVQKLALQNLQTSVNQGFFPMNYFKVDPALNSIKNTQRFNSIIEQATLRHQAFAERFGLKPETNINLTAH